VLVPSGRAEEPRRADPSTGGEPCGPRLHAVGPGTPGDRPGVL